MLFQRVLVRFWISLKQDRLDASKQNDGTRNCPQNASSLRERPAGIGVLQLLEAEGLVLLDHNKVELCDAVHATCPGLEAEENGKY